MGAALGMRPHRYSRAGGLRFRGRSGRSWPAGRAHRISTGRPHGRPSMLSGPKRRGRLFATVLRRLLRTGDRSTTCGGRTSACSTAGARSGRQYDQRGTPSRRKIRWASGWPHHEPRTGPPAIRVATDGSFASVIRRKPLRISSSRTSDGPAFGMDAIGTYREERNSNTRFAARREVTCPGPSYSGVTSTRSKPTTSTPLRARTNVSAS